jgi:hypothetical protein
MQMIDLRWASTPRTKIDRSTFQQQAGQSLTGANRSIHFDPEQNFFAIQSET